MRRLAPNQVPKTPTLHDEFLPLTYALRVLTEDGKLVCRLRDDVTVMPERNPPVPEDTLRATGLDLDTADLSVFNIAGKLGPAFTEFSLDGNGRWARSCLQGNA